VVSRREFLDANFYSLRKKMGAAISSEAASMNEMATVYVALVEKYAALWHGGKIPSDREERTKLIVGILDAWLPESDSLLTGVFSVSAWLRYRDETARHLAEAVDVVARAQATRWTN
jgi:hypothetical protein